VLNLYSELMKNLASLTVFNDLMMILDCGLLFGPPCILGLYLISYNN